MKGKVRLFWMVGAVMLAVISLVACIYAGFFGSIWNQPGGNPQETVVRFFDSLKNGDTAGMYACLSDYASLGLETAPESREAQTVYEAMKKSYGYTLKGDCFVDGLEATQKVNFRALNVGRVENAASAKINEVLEELLAQLPEEEVYAEDGGYQESFTDRVYEAALEQVLRNPDPLCADSELEIHLQFIDGAWKMVTNRVLLNALVGGAG